MVTPLGLPYLDYLMPKRWYENEKYMSNGTRQPEGLSFGSAAALDSSQTHPGELLRQGGVLAYVLVDFEMLEFKPELL